MIRSHLGYRLEVVDDGGEGWIVHVRGRKGTVECTLRNRVPGGLEPLLMEARQRVDRVYATGDTPRW